MPKPVEHTLLADLLLAAVDDSNVAVVMGVSAGAINMSAKWIVV